MSHIEMNTFEVTLSRSDCKIMDSPKTNLMVSVSVVKLCVFHVDCVILSGLSVFVRVAGLDVVLSPTL
ncbi:hypothetical protein DPMN_057409 [Dreissena polymorpha]|uniref:Uncharacterized protein n=1 Tax=Dreissena polymorpha TaxID=45954 RepID=A0A9D4C056_DREPO|nr:hypothetical protein DPMN_057409 [Dreissena polymorpha]